MEIYAVHWTTYPAVGQYKLGHVSKLRLVWSWRQCVFRLYTRVLANVENVASEVLVVTGDKAVFQSKVPAGAYPEVVGNLLDQVVIVILTGWRQTLTCVP